MIVVRAVTKNDIDSLMKLAEKVGIGVTTIVADKKIFERKITRSIECFKTEVDDGYYLFVFEMDGQIVGCAAIDVKPGMYNPFYTYKILDIHNIFEPYQVDHRYQVLQMVNDFDQASELCSLFLLPDYRNKMNGYLLSYSRLLYAAAFPKKFTDIFFAEIRGDSDQDGNSPFWEAIGKHFYGLDFIKADKLSGVGEKQFIQALKPGFPIYIDMLPKAAQDVIGKPHYLSAPAMKLLEKQGFYYHRYIDIFDGGPTISTEKNNIKTVNQAQYCHIVSIAPETRGIDYMIASVKNDFRVTLTKLSSVNDSALSIPQSVADILKIDVGDQVIIAPLF